MILEAVIDEKVYSLNVPDSLLGDAVEFFAQLDRDMDCGWQMSRDWVAEPNRVQRAQIVADKLLTALENGNQKLGMLMAGYLLDRLPGLSRIELDIHGEIQNNQFHFAELQHQQAPDPDSTPGEPESVSSHQRSGASPAEIAEELAATAAISAGAPRGLNKLDAMAQAGRDVTKVFRVGKGYRFSVFDHASQSWQDGPLIKTEEEADRLRQRVFRARFEALQRE